MNMNTALPLPKARKQTLGSIMLSRLRIRVAAATDRGSAVTAEPRSYSFLSDCECPDDCLRDHENE